MGCCESRGDQLLKKYFKKHNRKDELKPRSSQPIPRGKEYSARSLVVQEIPEGAILPSEVGFNIRSLEEVSDKEVWDRIRFGDAIIQDQQGWNIEHVDTSKNYTIKSKLTSFQETTSHVIMTEYDFGKIVPINILVELLNDAKKRMKWEKILCHVETLGNDYNDYIFFSRVEITLFFKRYFTERKLTRIYKNQVCIVFYSVDVADEQVPQAIKQGARRLNSILGLYYIKKCKDTTKLVMITMIEPLFNNLEVKFTVNGIKSWLKALEKQLSKECIE